jgi:coenzyme F420-reducing hydrogenase beta subunit
MGLDDSGQYVPVRQGSSENDVNDALMRVNITSPWASDQTTIGKRLFSGDSGVEHDRIVGYYRSLYIGHVLNEEARLNSTSGGLTTWILCRLIEQGVIDGVIHMRHGRGGSEPLFEYGISKTPSEVRNAAKTRYYPGEVSRVLNEIRRGSAGQRFALVGIPEIVSEVRLLGEVIPEFGELIPFCIGLLCAHQKTTKYLESIAWQLGMDPNTLIDADFRLKKEGRSADRYITRVTGISGGAEVTRILEPEESLVANWGLGFFKSDFSDFTDDVFNETADVALGDAWLPQYSSDYRGHNVVIVRNAVIDAILLEGIESGEISLERVDVGTVCQCQPGLIRHSHEELGYRLFRLMKAGIVPPRTRVRPSGSLRFLRKLEQIQRMDNAFESREVFRRAEVLGEFRLFRRFAERKVLVHRVVRALELLTRRN